MEAEIFEHEKLLSMQESYFENLLEMGLFFENSGNIQKAFDVYKKGIEKAEQAKTDFVGTLLCLLD